MKAEYINPFVESVSDLFSTMLNCTAKRGSVSLEKGPASAGDVVAVIGLSGGHERMRGTVMLSLPRETAIAMAGRLLGTELAEWDDSVPDAVAELVNMVAGGAKARLPQRNGHALRLSLPTVISLGGNGTSSVQHGRETSWLNISFASELGPFSVRVTICVEGEQ